MENQILLEKLLPNEENPRFIRDEKFESLKKSIREFPQMMAKRPIVIDSWANPVVLGGNMRLIALKYTLIPAEWVTTADGWSEEQKREFIIKDNTDAGEWDYDRLANEWDSGQLEDWGVELPVVDNYASKNQEIDAGALSDLMVMKFTFAESDYHRVKAALATIDENPEDAILKIVAKLEEDDDAKDEDTE